MRRFNYILKGKTPVKCSDIMEFGRWFEKADRKVERTKVQDVEVSTVFLGVDHAWNDETPLLFETLIMGGPLDQEMLRYSTWDEAVEGHRVTVSRVEARQTRWARIKWIFYMLAVIAVSKVKKGIKKCLG